MKKKNVIGHMMLPEESKMGWIRRSALIPRLLCLLLAVLLWLIVSAADPSVGTEMPDGPVGAISSVEQ